jgi:uncharacterized protein (DUF58 family)
MIVPNHRLLFWVALIILPGSVLAALEPATAWFFFGGTAVLFGFAIVDAITARRSLAGISVEVPAVVRMSKDREARLPLRIRNQRQTSRQLRLGLPLPHVIQSEQEDTWIALPAGAEWSQIDWTCWPRKRGNYQLASACLESASPLGFWGIRKQVTLDCEIRVYPNLLTERKSLAALFLHRGLFGLHVQRQVGKGREFEQLREYLSGDSLDEVHWKATAKRGRPITKIFQVERTQEVYVVIDASRLSARTAQDGGVFIGKASHGTKPGKRPSSEQTIEAVGQTPSILERFITASLVLGLAAEQQGDLFGLVTFSDRVEKFIRARSGKAHYSACRDALYTLEPRIVTPDFDELCSFLRLRLRRRALLVFLTSLDDSLLAESFVRNIELLRGQHLVLVDMVQPPGLVPVFTNPNIASLDELYQHLGGHLLWQKLRELERILQRLGIRFSLLQNERLSTELVSQYLSVKKRQLL